MNHSYHDELSDEAIRRAAARVNRRHAEPVVIDDEQMSLVRLVNYFLAALFVWMVLIALFLTRVAPLFGWFR